jgi:TonB family protein
MKAVLRSVLCIVLLIICAGVVFESLTFAQEQSASDPVYEFHKVGDYGVTAPKPLYHPDPEYTDRARRKKISGSVVLSIVVTPEGTVRDAKVTTSLDKDLDQQALNTVATWKFEPATKDGKPVSVRIAVEMTFRIR